jgi:hypothetical protein
VHHVVPLGASQQALSKRLESEFLSKQKRYLQDTRILAQPQLSIETEKQLKLEEELDDDRKDSKAFADSIAR